MSVADVIIAVDEPIDATQCGGRENCHDDRQRCMTHELWSSLNTHIFTFLHSVTLAELVAQQQQPEVTLLQDQRAAGRASAHAGAGDRRLRTNLPPPQERRDEDPDLPRLLGDDAGRPARRAEDDPLLTEHFGNPASRSHSFGWDCREGGRGRARAGRGAGELRPAGDRLDVRRHRVEQPRAQRRRPLLQGQGQAHRHRPDRAQGHARHRARARARGLRGDLPRRLPDGLLDLEAFERGAAARHDPRVGDAREQRDRRRPGHRGDRRDLPRAGRHLPRRRGAGDGQDPDRPRRAEGRPDVVLGAQDVRPQGRRRAVRAAQAARAHRGADARRRSRARHALGHAAHAPDRRHGRGVPDRAARDGDRERADPDAARPAARAGPRRRSRRSTSTATSSTGCRTTST